MSSSPPRQLWSAYVRQLERSPLRVKMGSAVVIFGSSDLATQLVEGAPARKVDPLRTGRMVAFGCCATLFVHTWWGKLEPLAAAVFCPTASRLPNTLLKVSLDQTFGAGTFNLLFFAQSAAMEGHGVDGVADRVRSHWWPQMQRHWCFWPWFHSVNFYHNPLHVRVFFQNIALVGWGALLSSVGARAARGADRGAEDQAG